VPVIVLVWLALAAALIGVVMYALRVKRLRNTPEELCGDWWPRFEAEFRAYVVDREGLGRARRERGSPPRRTPRHTHRTDPLAGAAPSEVRAAQLARLAAQRAKRQLKAPLFFNRPGGVIGRAGIAC